MGTANTKICSSCLEEKLLTADFFIWRKDRNKWRNKCKLCFAAPKKEYRIPQAKLIYDSMDHINFKKCRALENLRPLSSKENLLKGAKF